MPLLYLATTNPGKVRDFVTAASQFGVEIAPLPGLRDIPEPVEDGDTFEANARLKAEYYSRLKPGLWVISDDSGLEVDALNGAPGVRSARFAADCSFTGDRGMTTDERNNGCLLAALSGVAEPRTARYRCILALALDGVVQQVADGVLEGQILRSPRGTGGFGYDPLVYLPEHRQTMAEIDPGIKQQISHRGRAFLALLQQLR